MVFGFGTDRPATAVCQKRTHTDESTEHAGFSNIGATGVKKGVTNETAYFFVEPNYYISPRAVW